MLLIMQKSSNLACFIWNYALSLNCQILPNAFFHGARAAGVFGLPSAERQILAKLSVRPSVRPATGATGSRLAPGHPPPPPALGVPPNACVAGGFPSKGRIWALVSVGLLRGNTGRGERALGRALGWQQQDQLVKSTCTLLLLLLQPHFPLAQELHTRNELFQR